MAANRIIVGIYEFEDDDILNGNCYIENDLTSSSLSINTFDAEVRCTDPALSNTAKNEKLTYFHNNAQTGVFFVQSVSRIGTDRYKLSAVSAMGLLDQRQHYGGIYTGQTAQELISDICGPVPVIVKSILAGMTLYGWLPIGTARENLAQVVFALGAAVKTDLNGVIRIEGLWDGVTCGIGMDQMSLGSAVEYSTPVTSVVVTEHQHVQVNEEDTLFEGATVEGDIITFSEPMHGLTASGFSILDSGANYAKVSAGSGTLTGKKYRHNTRQVIREVSQAQEESVVTVEEATLVSLVNSAAVADRLANFYACRETIRGDIACQTERPGDVVSQYHPFDKTTVSACLQSMDINLSRKLKATETGLVGYIPQQIEKTEILENRIILTGSGSWTVPDGVTSLRVVVIGSGNGGQAGADGTNGARTYLVLTSAEVNAGGSWSEAAGSPGIGGSGGQGGKGGRILQAVLEVEPGEVIQYSAAPGGSGGSENGSAGSTGGNTTFGNLTSANGSVNDSGYTDPISGITYAAKGKDGLDGGDGGKGGTASLNNFTEGEDGEAVGSYLGGDGGSGGYTNSSTGWMYMRYGGGGGGGAADGANGGGGNGTYGRDGGPGASPPSASNADTYGSGGDGGAGGGGGGSAGSVFFKSDGGTGSTGFWGTLSGGAAGVGAAGGAGADGCIIVYYAQEKTIATGQVVDKNNKMLLDRLGRRVIV